MFRLKEIVGSYILERSIICCYTCEVDHIVAKEEIAQYEQFLLLEQSVKSVTLQMYKNESGKLLYAADV